MIASVSLREEGGALYEYYYDHHPPYECLSAVPFRCSGFARCLREHKVPHQFQNQIAKG